MDMTASDILQVAVQNLVYLSPALLLICSLIFAEGMAETLINIIKNTRKHARI